MDPGGLFHGYRFDRALLGAIATTDARLEVDDAADIVHEVQRFLLAHIHAQTATGALIGIDGRPLFASFSHDFTS
jgi:hypothetical protein